MQGDSFSRSFSEDAARVRFVVGIDLGTTNSAVSYVDLDATERSLEILPIPQAVAVGVWEERSTLPSFFCRSSDAPTEPWNPERRDFSAKKLPKDGKIGVVGAFARDFGAAEPDSFVSSAKSWLCHSGVDRTAKILPWSTDAEAGALRWSPVEISSFFLARIRDAWNARFPEFPLETQDVVLTIPASFDETARELTIRAAKLAGIPKLALVEEPQAAFYAWLEGRENDWTEFVKPGEKILVCDVGGGTTDFALIYALERNDSAENGGNGKNGESGGVRFYRVAVGDHLILGGDNLDLALFHFLEQKFAEKRSSPLSARERAVLLRECRETKEFFLSANAENSEDAQNRKSRRVVLPGSGAKLVGGGLSVEVERADVEKILLDGFFPRVPLDAAPVRRRVGVREIALPYAPDPAITKYLAHFLTTRRDAGLELERSGIFDGSTERETDENGEVGQVGENGTSVDRASPDVVLFNGGAFESPTLRARIVDSLVDWFGGAETGWRPKVLQNENLYWAVAKGAAYYGLVRRGLGTRIGASLARTYYVGVATDEKTEKTGETDKSGKSDKAGGAAKAVCLLPARAEPGDEVTLPKTFELAVDRPVSFPIFVSSVRTTDAPG
ncbi:MAG: Hsp70 family protein, partial [Thermoguttaceae bacterium]|nr:Hsp70 family protein [Thermoguttaceae bacterium]